MAAWRSTSEWKAPRCRRRRVSAAKKVSTALSQEQEVGVIEDSSTERRASFLRASIASHAPYHHPVTAAPSFSELLTRRQLRIRALDDHQLQPDHLHCLAHRRQVRVDRGNLESVARFS